eukprot:gene2684-3807_t
MRLLEAVGRDVGEVVRDGVRLGLLGLHAGLRDPQGTHHGGGPRSGGVGDVWARGSGI